MSAELIKEFRPMLMDLHKTWDSVPYYYALIGHCIFCASTAPDLRAVSFFVHFWATFLTGFGGGQLSALLIMNPEKAPIALLHSNKLGLTFVACWWLMNYFPFGIPEKIHKLKPFRMLSKACVAFCKANLIINRVNIGAELFPGVLLGPILLGTIGASGGKFTVDTIRHFYGLLKTPHEASSPTSSWRGAFLGSAFYFLVSLFPSPLRVLTTAEASALLLTLFVGHSLLSDLTGLPLDWTKPIMSLLLTLANIPVPGAAPKAAAAAAPSKQAKRTNGSTNSGPPSVTGNDAAKQQQQQQWDVDQQDQQQAAVDAEAVKQAAAAQQSSAAAGLTKREKPVKTLQVKLAQQAQAQTQGQQAQGQQGETKGSKAQQASNGWVKVEAKKKK